MKRFPIALAALHALLIAAYTLPPEAVPVRVRYWSQAYARLLFHQDWRLFAPDPPACSCVLQVPQANGDVHGLAQVHDHFIWRRMCANACRYAEAVTCTGAVVQPSPLQRSLHRMAGGADTLLLDRGEACAGPPVPLPLGP